MIHINNYIIKKLLKPRLPNSSKATYGHALLIVGSKGSMGAAVLAAKACIRSGVGMLTVATAYTERAILQIDIPEAKVISYNEPITKLEQYKAIGIGSGVGFNEYTTNLLQLVLNTLTIPIVIDADALSIIHNNKLLLPIHNKFILTPHIIEYDRLYGVHKTHSIRIKSAIMQAKLQGVIIVLKNYNTVITDGTTTYINDISNTGLAKAGSGDALTGLITGLLAQGFSTLHAAIFGVHIHSIAASITLSTQSEESMIISDVIDNIGNAYKLIEK